MTTTPRPSDVRTEARRLCAALLGSRVTLQGAGHEIPMRVTKATVNADADVVSIECRLVSVDVPTETPLPDPNPVVPGR